MITHSYNGYRENKSKSGPEKEMQRETGTLWDSFRVLIIDETVLHTFSIAALVLWLWKTQTSL